MVDNSRIRPIEILLVEDNPGDVRLTQEALKESKINNNLIIAGDGVEAWDYLTKNVAGSDAILPDVIFLDLNMPRMDGRELLAKLKNHEHLRQIPIVVLTTSQAEEDILQSYNLHANCYVTKPVGLNEFVEVVRSIEHFWISIVKLPTRTETSIVSYKY